MIEKLKALMVDELMAAGNQHMIERLIQYNFSLDEIRQFFPNMTAEGIERYRNPNAMALAHLFDEIAQKMTAYEELKAWCEKWGIPLSCIDSRQIAIECSTEKCLGVNFVFDIQGKFQKTSLELE